MTSKDVWDKPIPIPEETITFVDEAVRQRLPKNTILKSIKASGSSYWSRTAKIETIDANGNEANYFLKVVNGEGGREQAQTEFLSMIMFHNNAPELASRPIASGAYHSMPNVYFILYEYYGFIDHSWPAPVCETYNFAKMVADMHKRTAWPGHKFGSLSRVYGGNVCHYFPPSDSWEWTFKEGMKAIWAKEAEVQGFDEELDFLERMTAEKVIPRLLGAMEHDGRKVVPSFCHGDLWEGNTGIDPTTGLPRMFDATPMYAPAEYEAGPWRPQRHLWYGDPFLAEYEKHIEPQEPKEEVRDRMELYALRFNSLSSCLYKGNLFFREIMKDDMRMLWSKYGEGYEPWAERQAQLKAVQEKALAREWKDISSNDGSSIKSPVATAVSVAGDAAT